VKLQPFEPSALFFHLTGGVAWCGLGASPWVFSCCVCLFFLFVVRVLFVFIFYFLFLRLLFRLLSGCMWRVLALGTRP
jgi:hypothetical protein